MIDPNKEANKIVDKLLVSTIPQLAVFVFPNGRIKTTKPSTDLFADAAKKFPMALAGVYDAKARPVDVAADIVATLEGQGVFLKAAA